MRNFLWCYYRRLITSLAFEKCKKESDIVEIILVQGFCPLKIEITKFSGGLRLPELPIKQKASWHKTINVTPIPKRHAFFLLVDEGLFCTIRFFPVEFKR